MKLLKISDQSHAWLAKEKERTGVPMATQIQRFIAEKEENNEQRLDKSAPKN